MRKWFVGAVAALALGGCQTVAQDRVASGAVLGGATGAVIGGVAGRSAGAALAGGAIGAVAGGMLGAATAPHGPCYVRNRYGRLVRVRC